jgi:UPF0755 protein
MRHLRGKIVLSSITLIVFLYCGFSFEKFQSEKLRVTDDNLFTVTKGQSANSISRNLEEKGWISDHRLMSIYIRALGYSNNLQAGTYVANPEDTKQSLLKRISDGDVATFSITFIEGTSIVDFMKVLENAPHIENTLNGSSGGRLMKELGLPEKHPEGLFFPSTYTYHAGDTDRSIMRRAYKRMGELLQSSWKDTPTKNLPYKTPYEALIMASIIEKETGLQTERSMIAGVFVRRLRSNMRLQSDPTVIYGLGESFTGNITRADLRKDTPYNTYTRFGLPPTPISAVGEASLKAAIAPLPGQELYFVSKGDGSHHFSKTFEEHKKAVRSYQLGL